mgnify:CR=1 FL=1
MKLYEFIRETCRETEETCRNPRIRFHVRGRSDLEVLSFYLSDDEKTLEIDIGDKTDA